MSTNYNPKIITDGLVLYLDAANPKSYPRSGNTWIDLSEYNNHGTLVNGVGYTANNKGSLVFDGVNDYVLHNLTNITRIQAKSVFSIVYLTNTSSLYYGRIVNHHPTTDDKFVLTLNRQNGASRSTFSIAGTPNFNSVFGETTTKFPINTWHYLGWVYDGSNFLAYCNGIPYPISDTSAGTYGFTGLNGLLIGARTDTAYYAKGNIPIVQIYNRALSADEIKQNFNALRSRYNI